MPLQLLQSAIGDVLSSPLVGLRAPVVMGEVDIKAAQSLRQDLQDGNGSVNDLRANAVGRD